MILDFSLILLCLTLFSGVVASVHYWLRSRTSAKNLPMLVDYARSLFPIFLIVLLLRSFVAQPFRVPTGSLEPTVLPGDFMLVTQYDYGFKLPVWRKTILSVSQPKRGDIALFYWPVDARITFVKRVVGVPGDHISYINKVLYINGVEMKQRLLQKQATSLEEPSVKMQQREEDLNGIKHSIYICAPDEQACPAQGHDFYNLSVPQGYYFMMGDNRDNSDDGRYWGLVPVQDFIGRARFIWLSWDATAPWYKKIRWHRIGDKL